MVVKALRNGKELGQSRCGVSVAIPRSVDHTGVFGRDVLTVTGVIACEAAAGCRTAPGRDGPDDDGDEVERVQPPGERNSR